MTLTIFTTPLLSAFLRLGSIGFLRLTGWKVEGQLPAEAHKAVLIAAPHTSNWDLPYTLMVAFALRLNVRWMGKRELFRRPFGGVMRWLGGIPVNREQASNLVAASAEAIQRAATPLQLIVPPEGTRSKVREWKTGFYWIAQTAQVPIVLAYMDYAKKRSGLGPLFQPTGDVDADMARIKAFYAPFKGRNAQQFDVTHSKS
jgi:1-acyl-sn-glycerol-3-phosphate acyltransferase